MGHEDEQGNNGLCKLPLVRLRLPPIMQSDWLDDWLRIIFPSFSLFHFPAPSRSFSFEAAHVPEAGTM